MKDEPKIPSLEPIEDWEKRFDEKVNEIRRYIPFEDDDENTVFEFGYKVRRNDEFFTITDWGNIKNTIKSLLSSQSSKIK